MSISKEEVILGYRLFLDRDPESDSVIQEKMACNSKSELIAVFLQSDEFKEKNCEIAEERINAWVLTETPYNFRIWVNLADLAISRNIIKNNFESAEVVFVQKHVSKGNTVIDIGANIGFFSMLTAAQVGEGGRVISFEPLTFLYEAAKRSAGENGFTHCTVHNVALAGHRGTAKLVYAPNSPNWGGAFLSFDNSVLPNHTAIDVPIAPLSDFTQGLKADFIKIDVEGAEYKVLQSSLDYIKEFKPIIMSEIHRSQLSRVSNVTAEEYISLFTDIGYQCRVIQSDGLLGDVLVGNEDFMLINVAFVYDK